MSSIPSPALSSRFKDARLRWITGVVLAGLSLAGASGLAAAEAPVSWFREVTPIFKRSCNGCHNPNKLKGQVDTSTYAGFLKAGKHGPNFVAGDAEKSLLV